MAFGGNTATQAAGLIRPLALLACALALGLLCWRGAALLTGPPAPAAASPAEAALSDVLAPVAGPGRSRVSITYNAEGGRTVLVLVDEHASARLPELQRIAPLAAGIMPDRGDRFVIETLTFAEGLPGRPDAAAWAELASLAALTLISGALAMLAGRSAPAAPSAAQVLAASGQFERPREPARAVRPAPVALPSADTALDIARRDPVRAAAVVRGWMQAKDDPA